MDFQWAAIIAVCIQAAALFVWGARLTQRVKALEADIITLKSLDLQVARIEVKQEAMNEMLKDMNANLRWLRQPADYSPKDLQRPGG